MADNALFRTAVARVLAVIALRVVVVDLASAAAATPPSPLSPFSNSDRSCGVEMQNCRGVTIDTQANTIEFVEVSFGNSLGIITGREGVCEREKRRVDDSLPVSKLKAKTVSVTADEWSEFSFMLTPVIS